MRISDWSADVCSSDLVLYRDAHLLIADKPHFLPVVPSGRFVQQTLLVRLKRETGVDGLAPLHRIDRATAGLVAFSLDPATRGRYQSLFAQRSIEKRYEALENGRASCRERVCQHV